MSLTPAFTLYHKRAAGIFGVNHSLSCFIFVISIKIVGIMVCNRVMSKSKNLHPEWVLRDCGGGGGAGPQDPEAEPRWGSTGIDPGSSRWDFKVALSCFQ